MAIHPQSKDRRRGEGEGDGDGAGAWPCSPVAPIKGSTLVLAAWTYARSVQAFLVHTQKQDLGRPGSTDSSSQHLLR